MIQSVEAEFYLKETGNGKMQTWHFNKCFTCSFRHLAALAVATTLSLASAAPAAAQGVCNRTPEVRDVIVAHIANVSGKTTCASITTTDLNGITSLNLNGTPSTATLKTGDFEGLTNLRSLNLGKNSLRSLPADIFDDLARLTSLHLHRNSLNSLPAGVFDNLTGLTHLYLSRNSLSSLPPGVFDNLTKLARLDLHKNNNLSCLPVIPASVTTLNLDNKRSTYSACGATLTVTAHASDSTQATLTITKHSGGWYYKANTAPYAACSAEVSSETMPASLTNLAGNTSYIFTPYRDSSCLTKLGRATTAYLTKPGEPDVSVAAGAGSGKLTLSASVTGSGTLSMWQYRQKATSDPDYGNGNEENITATSTSLSHTVSGLTNGTSYQFQVRAVNADRRRGVVGRGDRDPAPDCEPSGGDNGNPDRKRGEGSNGDPDDQRPHRGLVISGQPSPAGHAVVH